MVTEEGAATEWGESEGVPQSPAQRREQGRALRKSVPRSSHAGWVPGADRADPVALLEGQNEGRVPWLVPIRRGRMMVSPFTFYRGAARIMAHDLATTPSSGLNVQVCGDGHLSNFGVYGSPERQLVFDINDFDETLPGPWEWDVKRLAASFVIAGRHRGFGEEDNRTIAARSVTSYRETMLELAEKPTLDVWYAHLSTERLATLVEESGRKRTAKRIGRIAEKARRKDGLQAFRKLAEKSGGSYRIRSDHPVLVPIRDVERYYGFEYFQDADEFTAELHRSFEDYRSTLRPDRQLLLGRFRPVDIALKVVGVGSVGTRCFILLLEGKDEEDPLFLQVKQATPSVLEEHLPASRWRNSGRRVVEGQRLMQSASDVFLGWSRGVQGHEYYWRQLRDWKGSADVETAGRNNLADYATICGWTLARSHARSGDPIAIAAYLGSGSVFDVAITEFANQYADQNEGDYKEFVDAIRSGRLEADESK
jgi:uncharacterized protein (DUF2252 family)